MKISSLTPNGRKISDVTEKDYTAKVIDELRKIVRETSYHLARLEAENVIQDESWSRSVCLRQQAVDALRTFDSEAEDFIGQTYKPKTFLH